MQAECQVVMHGEVIEQVVFLEYRGHWTLPRRTLQQILALPLHASRLRRQKAGQEAEQRALATAAGTCDAQALATSETEAEIESPPGVNRMRGIRIAKT
ncbi:hypothetical protein RE428_30550 [Marinobacter nanhaiticus D15-8W]|nr:hypothetical protein RE428_30550 [Marinobacter nanhaiticus D15-8W]